VPVKLPADAGPFERQLYRINITRPVERLKRTLTLVPYRKPVIGEVEFTSGFGVRRIHFWGAPRCIPAWISAATGDPVRATQRNGRLIGVDGGYGRMVEIDHGNGLAPATVICRRSTFGSAIRSESDSDRAVGSTGRSTGPHLHYETRIDGEAVDPQKFLRAGVRLSAG